MRPYYIILIFLLSGSLLQAQGSIPPHPTGDSIPDYIPAKQTFILYVEPGAALDGANGASFRFGAEYQFASQWAVYSTWGSYFEKGYILRTGIKRFVNQVGSWRYAIALEYINSWHIHRVDDNYKDSASSINPDNNRPISFTTEKYINAVSVIMSGQQFWRHHWVFEIYGGLGVKFKHVLTSIPQSQLDLLYHYHESEIENAGTTPGKFITLDVRAGLKFGRVFERRHSGASHIP